LLVLPSPHYHPHNTQQRQAVGFGRHGRYANTKDICYAKVIVGVAIAALPSARHSKTAGSGLRVIAGNCNCNG